MDVLARVSEATGVPADLLSGCRPALTSAASTGRLPDRGEIDAFRSLGGKAAEAGVPLRAITAACLMTAELSVGTAPPAVFTALRRILAAYGEGYEEAQRQALRREEAARQEFVDDLLHGRADRLAERAHHFGLGLAESYAVAVARAATPIAAGDPLAGRIERALAARFGSRNILVAVREGMLVCVTPGSLTAATGEFTHHVRGALSGGWRVGIGRPHRGPGGVVTSYREATGAIETGDRLGLRPQVLKASDLLVFPVLLRDRAAIEDLVSSVLSPLRDARGGPEPLLETLEAVFAAQGNQTAAARRLGVSTRAVTYRLERVRRLTGFSPDEPTQRFTLETAVLGARLLGWPAEPFREVP
jgi:sugar diacid utilization regulator